MACFHRLLGLLKSLLGCVIKKDLQKEQGGPRVCVGAPLSPQGPVESPALAPPVCHWEQPSHGLGETHQDESMGQALSGSLDRWGVIACRQETLCRGRAFWMGRLEEGTKVVKGRDQGVLGRNKHGKTEGKWDKRGWWHGSEC